MNKKKLSTLFIVQAAMIAAIYVVLTVFISAFGLASGAIQVRISEALCILPVFTPAAVPGLFVGCLIANIIVPGAGLADIVFGSLATLIAAVFSYLLRKKGFLATLPPVIANAIIIPLVLKYAGGMGDAFWFLALTVGAGEMISVCLLGWLLKVLLWKYRNIIFKTDDFSRNE